MSRTFEFDEVSSSLEAFPEIKLFKILISQHGGNLNLKCNTYKFIDLFSLVELCASYDCQKFPITLPF